MKKEILHKLKQLEGSYFTHTRSKAGQWLHYKMERVREGEVEVTLTVREEMTNPGGTLHGGMIGMISDEICGLAFYSVGQAHFYTTVNLSIDYLYSAPLGTTVRAVGRVVRWGKKIANTECYIYDEEGRIISHATSNLVNTGKEVFEITMPEV